MPPRFMPFIGPKGGTGAAGKAGLVLPGIDGQDGIDGVSIVGPAGKPGPAGANGKAGPAGIGLDGHDGDDAGLFPLSRVPRGVWRTYDPVGAQGATIATSTLQGTYLRIPAFHLTYVVARIRFTAAGAAGNDITCSLPVPCLFTTNVPLGVAVYNIPAGGQYKLSTQFIPPSGLVAFRVVSDTTTSANLGSVPSFAVANLDVLSFSALYQSV